MADKNKAYIYGKSPAPRSWHEAIKILKSMTQKRHLRGLFRDSKYGQSKR